MALSEREQQMLDEMEQALYAEDPRFASQMQGRATAADRRRRVIGVLGAVAGLALVILGINVNMWIGVAGFVVIVASIAFAVMPSGHGSTAPIGVVQEDGSVAGRVPRRPAQRRGQVPGRVPRIGGEARPGGSGSFMKRLEERWEERRRQQFGD